MSGPRMRELVWSVMVSGKHLEHVTPSKIHGKMGILISNVICAGALGALGKDDTYLDLEHALWPNIFLHHTLFKDICNEYVICNL